MYIQQQWKTKLPDTCLGLSHCAFFQRLISTTDHCLGLLCVHKLTLDYGKHPYKKRLQDYLMVTQAKQMRHDGHRSDTYTAERGYMQLTSLTLNNYLYL